MRRAHRALLAIVLLNISLQHSLSARDTISVLASLLVVFSLLLFIYLE